VNAGPAKRMEEASGRMPPSIAWKYFPQARRASDTLADPTRSSCWQLIE